MPDIVQEYATDPTTGETIAVDPPLQQSEAPLMGNPILSRTNAPRRANSNTALYAGAAVALVAVLAGGAYLIASGVHQRSDLVTSAETAPPSQEQAAVTPAAAPVATPTAPIVASAETPEQPLRVARAERAEVRAVRHTEHRAAARAAAEQGADASATVATPSQIAPAPVMAAPPVIATPAPAPEAAPAAPPVITPPPSQ
jgi:hypothetical protein